MRRKQSLLRRIAMEVLGPADASRIWKRVEIIGDIAIIRRPFNYPIEKLKVLAENLIKYLPYVKSIWLATSEVKGEYRLRDFIHLAGEPRSTTMYKEHGCAFKVDIKSVYVSPRLGYEHIRIAKQVKSGEIVINMFAGAGLFSILIAKYSKPKKVISIDINPKAIELMRENAKINNVEDVVEIIQGDAGKVIENYYCLANRVLMPLPELCYKYLPKAIKALKPHRGYIHVYDFISNVNKRLKAIQKAKDKYEKRLSSIDGVKDFSIVFARVVRSAGPKKYQVALDIEIGKDRC